MSNGLIDFARFNPSAAFAGGLESGSNLVGGIQNDIARRKERERLSAARALLGQTTGSELAGLSPELYSVEQKFLANQAATEQANNQRMLESVARDAKTALDIPDAVQRNQFLGNRAQRIISEGGDPSDTLALMELPFEQQNFELKDAINQVATVSQLARTGTGGNVQSSQFIPGVGFATLTKSGEASVIPVEGAGETAEERRTAEREKTAGLARTTADIAVKETEQKEIIKQRVKRSSDIKRELSDRNRGAARSGRLINEALTFAEGASQGLTGAAKVKLSSLLPGIDASDESGLDSALKQLALEQLQNFKGPTTDFEFGVTENIVGGIGNSKESNRARLKSLQRASWFNQREFDQFQNHTRRGGDPDTFRFNFGEPVDTKKGVFTLQQLQDTAVQNNISIDDVLKRLNK